MGSHPLATPALHLEALPVAERILHPAVVARAPNGAMTYVVRTEGDPSASIPAIQSAVWAAAPDLAFYSVSTVDALLSRTLATRRFTMTLLTLFGVAALTLAGLGIYGVIAVATAQRTREFGLRIVMGARPRDVVWMVVRGTAGCRRRRRAAIPPQAGGPGPRTTRETAPPPERTPPAYARSRSDPRRTPRTSPPPPAPPRRSPAATRGRPSPPAPRLRSPPRPRPGRPPASRPLAPDPLRDAVRHRPPRHGRGGGVGGGLAARLRVGTGTRGPRWTLTPIAGLERHLHRLQGRRTPCPARGTARSMKRRRNGSSRRWARAGGPNRVARRDAARRNPGAPIGESRSSTPAAPLGGAAGHRPGPALESAHRSRGRRAGGRRAGEPREGSPRGVGVPNSSRGRTNRSGRHGVGWKVPDGHLRRPVRRPLDPAVP